MPRRRRPSYARRKFQQKFPGNGFAGAGGGNNKVFEALAVFALYLQRFKDTRLVGVRRNVEEDSMARYSYTCAF